ncbi:MAG TPA: hypothetical protein VL137_12740 [Polyangiaceae bacterium]|nr:hypothetical protein [Polyangiaceae bacterium]
MPAQLAITSAAGTSAMSGTTIALFTGAKSTLVVTDPVVAGTSKAKIKTGSGSGNIAIEGLVERAALPLRSRSALVVVPDHVWIAPGTPLVISDVAPGHLDVEARLSQPMMQTFSAWADCSALTFSTVTRPDWAVPEDALGYVMTGGTLDLFDDSSAERQQIWTVRRSKNSGAVLFWGGEKENGLVKISYHGDVIIEGWAKLQQLRALPPGETIDQLPPPSEVVTSQINVPPRPKVARVIKPGLVRSQPNAAALVLGLAEPQAQVYILDIVGTWASILPTAANVVPPTGKQFWVDKATVGL